MLVAHRQALQRQLIRADGECAGHFLSQVQVLAPRADRGGPVDKAADHRVCNQLVSVLLADVVLIGDDHKDRLAVRALDDLNITRWSLCYWLQTSKSRPMSLSQALAFRSGVSVKAIKEFESGKRQLRRVSLQALAFCMQVQGLVFIPHSDPFRSDSLAGAIEDPRQRPDYHLIE